MALNSDRDGFLLPDERLSGDDLAQGIRGIKRNTDAILALLRARTRSLDRSRVANPNARQRTSGGSPGPAPAQRQERDRTSTPIPSGGGSGGRAGSAGGGERARDGRGRFVRDPAAEVAGEVRQLTRQQAQQNAERERAEEARRTREGGGNRNQTRGADGRFGSGGGSADENKSVLDRMKDFFKDRSGGPALDGADKVDPVIESAKEVMGMVGGAVGALKATGELGRAVIGRGFGGRRTEGDAQTPWFKRLLQQLKLMRRDDAQHNRAELRALNEPRGGGGGSIITDLLKLIFSPLGAAIVAALAGIWMGFGDKITGAWNSFIEGVKAKWDSAINTFMGIWEPIAKFFAGKFGVANKAIENVTGVNVKEKAGQVADAAGRATDKAAEKAGSLVERFKPGYRHTATFDGIKGGDKLTKDGRYTDAEAEKIRQLKTSGANTSANLPGGMSKQTRDKIIGQSKAGGMDPETMLKFAAMESGGNPNAVSATGAIGIFQMTGRTASGLGIRDRFNEDQNIAGGVKLAQENAAALKAARLPATAENLYMMHQLGPEAAKEVIRGAASGKQVSELSKGTQAAIANNHGAGSKTAAEYLGKNRTALDARYASLVPTGAGTSAMPSAALSRVPAVTPTMAGAVPAPGALPGPSRTPAVTVPTQTPPAPAPRTDTPIPLGSKGPLEVTVRNGEKMAGQDMKDRRLAHIATGGMSA